MIELELTYLAKELPDDLFESPNKEIIDVYFPKDEKHPKIRLRKNGRQFELTKKTPIDGDTSKLKEETIILSEEEFKFFERIPGKRVAKKRYYYKFNEHTAEFDIFTEDLTGLVVIDFEFETEDEKKTFRPPEYCGADITHEEFIAGGMICGKTYADLKTDLEKLNYKKLTPKLP